MPLVTTTTDWLDLDNPIARFCRVLDKDGKEIKYVQKYNNATKEAFVYVNDERGIQMNAQQSGTEGYVEPIKKLIETVLEGSRLVFIKTVVATDEFLEDQSKSAAPIKLEV